MAARPGKPAWCWTGGEQDHVDSGPARLVRDRLSGLQARFPTRASDLHPSWGGWPWNVSTGYDLVVIDPVLVQTPAVPCTENSGKFHDSVFHGFRCRQACFAPKSSGDPNP